MGSVKLAVSKRDAADALGVSVRHFERHVQDALPVVYSGRRRLYPVRDLERWLEARSTVHGEGR